MSGFRVALFAGAATLAVIAGAGLAQARSAATHTMMVALPDGQVAEIRYTGDVPPQVSLGAAPWLRTALAPLSDPFGAGSPFAELERISAEMDRRAAALLQASDALSAGRLSPAAFGQLPPGTQGYTFISTASGNGVCSRSVEITSLGNGSAPKVVTHSSGDCGALSGGGTMTRQPAVTRLAPQPPLVETRNPAPPPSAGLVREAIWQH